MRKQELEQELAAARNAFMAALRAVEIDPCVAPLFGTWSAKDIAGHIASCENRVLTLVHRLHNSEGWPEAASEEASTEWTEREIRRKRGWSWVDVINELFWVREELMGMLDTIVEGEFDVEYPASDSKVSIASLVRTCIVHDQAHTQDLQGIKQEGNFKAET